jgi:DNA-binding NarL/FixJ family response regulator
VAFSFLERSIRILVVDDEPALVDVYLEHLNDYPLYNATHAFSAKMADSILSKSHGCHVCLLDLGMNDLNNDEYYLIKKYSPKTSFIIVSARDSLEKGFKAGSCGALAAMKKPVDFFKLDIFDRINEAFSRSIVMPEKINRCKPVIRTAVDVLIATRPDSVQQWAESVGVDERYLRKVWEECYGYLPKHMLWFNRFFYFASLYYNNYYRKKFRIKTAIDDTRVEKAGISSDQSDQFIEYFSIHKKNIFRILNRVSAS